MKRADIARSVAHQLFAAEAALDAAVRDYARLTAEMMEAWARMNVSSTVMAAAVGRAAAVGTALAQAHVESAALHAALADVRDGLGLRTVDVGGGDKTDARPVWPLGSAVVEPLRQAG